MKLLFLVIAILINFFNPSFIKSEEKIDSTNNIINNNPKKESNTQNKNDIRKIHIVQIGDTISSISKFYSINKDLIIKLNNLKNEDYIYVGQNLIISEPTKNSTIKSELINNYHVVQIGENLTEISNKYELNLGYLIEINNLKNPDTIKVGDKLLLSNKNTLNSQNYQKIENKKNNELLGLGKKIYGPIIIQSKSYKKINGRKVLILNALNQQNKKLMLSIDCDRNELDVKFPRRKWKGGEPPKKEFEKNLINDFC